MNFIQQQDKNKASCYLCRPFQILLSVISVISNPDSEDHFHLKKKYYYYIWDLMSEISYEGEPNTVFDLCEVKEIQLSQKKDHFSSAERETPTTLHIKVYLQMLVCLLHLFKKKKKKKKVA